MSMLEVVLYGPFFCVVFACAGRFLLEITEGIPDRPWLGKIAVAIALVFAVVATWAVGSMARLGEPVAANEYAEPEPINYGRFTR